MLISDAEIAAAVPVLVELVKIVPEPAGATALGALLAGRVTLPPEGPVVVIVSGGNVDLTRLVDLIAARE